MGLTHCYKTTVFFYIYHSYSTQSTKFWGNGIKSMCIAGKLKNVVSQSSDTVSEAAQYRCTVVRPMLKSIGKSKIRPPVKS